MGDNILDFKKGSAIALNNEELKHEQLVKDAQEKLDAATLAQKNAEEELIEALVNQKVSKQQRSGRAVNKTNIRLNILMSLQAKGLGY